MIDLRWILLIDSEIHNAKVLTGEFNKNFCIDCARKSSKFLDSDLLSRIRIKE